MFYVTAKIKGKKVYLGQHCGSVGGNPFWAMDDNVAKGLSSEKEAFDFAVAMFNKLPDSKTDVAGDFITIEKREYLYVAFFKQH
jgi:hypothetical protein